MQQRIINLLNELSRRSSSSNNSRGESRRLRLETLENREMLSATTWQTPATVADNQAIVMSALTADAPISLANLDASVEAIQASPVAVGSNKASIEWTRVEGATKYYLMSSTSTDGENYSAWSGLKFVNDPGEASDAQTVATQMTLTAGKFYKFKVRAVTPDGVTDFTETTEPIVETKPTTPAITSATVDHDTGIATVEFDTVENASLYRVDYTFDDGATWQFAKYLCVGEGEPTSSKIYIDGDASSVTFAQKINANKTYYFRVRASNNFGASEYSELSNPIAYTGAPAPETVTATVQDGSHYATIAWTASQGATEYFIESTTNGGETWGAVKKASADDFTYDEATDSYTYSYFISADKEYQYRVRAYNNLGTDGSVTVSNETVRLPVVGAVENFTIADAQSVNPTSYPVGEQYSKVAITLKWDPADNAAKYVVKYSKDGAEWKLLKNINDPNVTSVTFNAVAGSVYNFQIMATNSLSFSEKVETGGYGVYKAALNQVDVVERETLTIESYAPDDPVLKCQWQYRTVDGLWADIPDATEYNYTPTAQDVANKYWIRAVLYGAQENCPAGSYVAEAVAGPVVESLEAPSEFTFGEYDPQTHDLTMTWVDNSDVEDGFYVEYSVDGGQTWAKSEWLGQDVTERVDKVYEGNDYLFRVRAYNAQGYSVWTYSDEIDVLGHVTLTADYERYDSTDNYYVSEVGVTLAATLDREYADGSVKYVWVVDGEEYEGTDAYTTTADDIGKTIAVKAVGDGQNVVGANTAESAYRIKEAPTLCVTTNADVVDEFDGIISLREAILYAQNYSTRVGSEVAFDTQLNDQTITLTEGELTVDLSLTFNGADQNITVSGNDKSRIFNLTASDVEFDGLKLANGSAYQGGAVLAADDITGITFENCVFMSNTSEDMGGAFKGRKCNSTFVNCVFTNNSSNRAGGAVSITPIDSKFVNCVFTDNISLNGGAIFMNGTRDSTYSMTVVNSVFSANKSLGDSGGYGGGAIFCNAGQLTLQHVTVVGNSAGRAGGGLYLASSSAQVNVINSIIYGNDASYTGSNVSANAISFTASNILTYSANGAWAGATASSVPNVIELADNDALASVLNPETFELVAGSPAINAGLHELTPDVTTDLKGLERDDQPDLGAFEYVASSNAVLDDALAELVDDLEIDL